MDASIFNAINIVHAGIGQGSVLEQIDKRFRKQQRLNLIKSLKR